jgi:hypothetical protein
MFSTSALATWANTVSIVIAVEFVAFRFFDWTMRLVLRFCDFAAKFGRFARHSTILDSGGSTDVEDCQTANPPLPRAGLGGNLLLVSEKLSNYKKTVYQGDTVGRRTYRDGLPRTHKDENPHGGVAGEQANARIALG